VAVPERPQEQLLRRRTAAGLLFVYPCTRPGCDLGTAAVECWGCGSPTDLDRPVDLKHAPRQPGNPIVV
jgi:hypothetical protein